MAKKVSKKTTATADDSLDFMKKLQKGLKSKTLLLNDDLSSFIPWRVPFKHVGLQKITGGLLGGKVMCIDAESQCGKSFLLYELLGSCIKMGGYGYIVDAERAFEPTYGQVAGIDFSQNRLLIDESTVVEDIGSSMDTYIKAVRDRIKDSSVPIIVSLDSTAATRCKEQYTNDQKDKDTGYGFMKRANALYEMVDKLIPVLDQYSASLVLIGQTRIDSKAGPFNDPTKRMLKELEFRATQMLMGKRSSMEKDEEDKARKLGMNVRWETYKNRFVKPKQVVKLKYMYESGLSPYSGLFDILVREKEITKADMKDPTDGKKKIKGCIVTADESKTFYAMSDARKMFEVHPHLLEPQFVKVHDGDESDDGLDDNEIEQTVEGIE